MKKIFSIICSILLFFIFSAHVFAMSFSAATLEHTNQENYHMMQHDSQENHKKLHECCQDDDSFEACIEISLPQKTGEFFTQVQENLSILPLFLWENISYFDDFIYYSQSPPENFRFKVFLEKQVSLYTPLTGISIAIL